MVRFRSDMRVRVVQGMGSELMIVNAARVSTGRESLELTEADKRLLRALVVEGHGSPLEHTAYTFEIECPIFVSRQIVKYRTSSINEVSGRYTTLPDDFYVPEFSRPAVQVGKSMDYKFEVVAPRTRARLGLALYRQWLKESARAYVNARNHALGAGLAKEVARMGTPTHQYTRLWVTMNLRTALHFIAQRIDNPDADRPSHGQYEIGLVAQQIRDIVAADYPHVWAAFEETKWKKI